MSSIRHPDGHADAPGQLLLGALVALGVQGCDEGLLGHFDAAAAVAAEASKGQVAYGGTLDGSEIYGQLCTGCHTSGAGGAPKLEKAAWGARIAQGNDILHKHAIVGFTGAAGMMPARGGNPSLSDEQVIATVDWMLANLK